MSAHLESLAAASDAVLDCRDMGHQWARTDDRNLTTNSRGQYIEFTRTDKCIRCGATRRRRIELPSFRIISTTMHYPDNYLAPKGSRYTRADARATSFNRIIGAIGK